MNILRNFDTETDARIVERYLHQRVGGLQNYEKGANSVPNDLPWDQVYQNAIKAWQDGTIGPN
jgi:hypothetical protein